MSICRLRGSSTKTGWYLPVWLALIFSFPAYLTVVTDAHAQKFTVPFEANQYIKDQIDAFRAQNGASKLKMNHPANVAADQYAAFLASNNKSGHTADGKDPAGRVTAAKGKFCKVWENVHESWSTSKKSKEHPLQAMAKAMEFWKTSPEHRANLLSASTGMGIGAHGWKHGDRWYYKEVVVFVDTSCL